MNSCFGINIGLETFECGVYRNERVYIVRIQCDQTATPTYVCYYPESSCICVGFAAKYRLSGYIYDVLKLIGARYDSPEIQDNISKWPFKVVESDDGEAVVELQHNNETIHVNGIDLLCEIFKYGKYECDNFCGNNKNLPTPCVISIPSYMNEKQRKCIKEAAKKAGLEVKNILSSSLCANIGYIHDNHKSGGINLIFDLENGVFNVDIIMYNELLYSYHDYYFYYNSMIDNVCNYYHNLYKTKTGKELNSKQLLRLRRDCEQAVNMLNEYGIDEVDVDYEFLEDEGIDCRLYLGEFNYLNEDIFNKIIEKTKEAVEESGLLESNIDNIILVGNGSRIKRIKELLKINFKHSYLNCYDYPELICAEGATIVANFDDYKFIDLFEILENVEKLPLKNIISSLNSIKNDIKSKELIYAIKEINKYLKYEEYEKERNNKYLSQIEVYFYYYYVFYS